MKLSQLLHDRPLEKRLLTSLIAKPETYFEVVDLLTPEAFSDENRAVFCDVVTAIEKQGTMPVFGVHEVSADPKKDATKLANLYQKSLLANELDAVLSLMPKEESAEAIINKLEETITRVQQSILELRSGQAQSVPDLFPALMKTLEEAHRRQQENKNDPMGIPTGFPRLDYHLSGFQKGIHLLAAEPGFGKTTFCLNVAVNSSKRGFPVLFVSFEETIENLALKGLCLQGKIDLKSVKDGKIVPVVFKQKTSQALANMERIFFIEGSAKTSVPQIKAKALQIMNRFKKDRCLIFIDYTQKWASRINTSTRDFRHIVNALAGELRDLANRLNSPVVAISSQNRAERGVAKMSSLKESGDLEYDGDSVMFLTENTEARVSAPARSINLVIEKNRYGDKGKIPLIFQPQYGLFTEESMGVGN